MKQISSIILLFITSIAFAQENPVWTKEDSLQGEQMIKTIEQSLEAYYADFSGQSNFDSIVAALNFEPNEIPKFTDEVYCERLEVMNEMSPFHLDCNDITLKSIKFFVENRRGFAKVVLGRSALYFDLYEEKLAEYELPIELKYLSVIESGLRPQIKSRAGALGLWQFMYRTGRMFGLEENSYIDERMDPVKATDAACRYLKMLYGMYNDWNVALAAYNAGPGNVNKAIRRAGNKIDYWAIRPYLPKETQGYVPNFISAAYLLTYHAEHNIQPAEAKRYYYELDTMCLSKGVHFETISELLNIPMEEVQELNPIYKKDYIPYGVPFQCVQLPLTEIGNLVTLEDSLYALEIAKYQTATEQPQETTNSTPSNTESSENVVSHKVASGESLSSIATRYGTTVDEIKKLNGLSSDHIVVGQRLRIKGDGNTQTQEQTTTVQKKYYTVKSGDTFGRIAQNNGMSISQLSKLNPGIDINRLNIGQRIRVK